MIPVNEPLLNGNEKRYLCECVETGWVSSEGPFVKRLEEGVAQRVGRKFAVAVCNGSAALDLAVAALRLGRGDEVILPTFTIISCAQSVVRAGATPVVVDIDPATWNMDLDLVADKITSRTKAIMVVHIYGMPVDMDPVLALARQHGLKVIEDSAEAMGQAYKGRLCGGMGDLSTFSFYPNKHLTTGEGGMVLTDDPDLAARCRSMQNLCFQKKRFVHEELGWNFRISNVQAALGVAQLERLDEFIEIKRNMGRRYTELLKDVRGLQLPVPSTPFAQNIYWVFGVVLADDLEFDAEEAMKRLGARGIGTRPFFWPMHEQPVFRKMGLARRGFYLPSGLALTAEQMECVAQAVKELVDA
jgi:perosamine synthetase